MRLDQFISQKFSYTRTKSKQLIESGFVLVNGEKSKVSHEVKDSDNVELIENFKFASLGGDKLEKAFNDFNYSVDGKVCIDIGASNGGFTDCMLKRGAKKVYALDVGECALPQSLIDDPRVVVKDRLNARYVTPKDIGELCDFASIDVSFISLTYVLQNVANLLKPNGEIIALIKPQFEVGKKYLSKRGIVQSNKAIDDTIANIQEFAKSIGLNPIRITHAPIKPNKNKEFLIYVKKV